MEKGQIDLKQLNRLVSWKVFLPCNLWKCIRSLFRTHGPRIRSPQQVAEKRNGIYVATILLLMWPATLSAPVLTSAIDWKVHTTYTDDPSTYPR
jgi:hypothetical protein